MCSLTCLARPAMWQNRPPRQACKTTAKKAVHHNVGNTQDTIVQCKCWPSLCHLMQAGMLIRCSDANQLCNSCTKLEQKLFCSCAYLECIGCSTGNCADMPLVTTSAVRIVTISVRPEVAAWPTEQHAKVASARAASLWLCCNMLLITQALLHQQDKEEVGSSRDLSTITHESLASPIDSHRPTRQRWRW